jgi:hypothetical protein
MNDEPEMVDFNEISDTEAKPPVILDTSDRNSYFIVYYDKKRSDDIRSMLSDKIMKLNKFSSDEPLIPAQEKSKNIYFLFLDTERKLIKAIMKKDYIKSDKNLKLETKIK